MDAGVLHYHLLLQWPGSVPCLPLWGRWQPKGLPEEGNTISPANSNIGKLLPHLSRPPSGGTLPNGEGFGVTRNDHSAQKAHADTTWALQFTNLHCVQNLSYTQSFCRLSAIRTICDSVTAAYPVQSVAAFAAFLLFYTSVRRIIYRNITITRAFCTFSTVAPAIDFLSPKTGIAFILKVVSNIKLVRTATIVGGSVRRFLSNVELVIVECIAIYAVRAFPRMFAIAIHTVSGSLTVGTGIITSDTVFAPTAITAVALLFSGTITEGTFSPIAVIAKNFPVIALMFLCFVACQKSEFSSSIVATFSLTGDTSFFSITNMAGLSSIFAEYAFLITTIAAVHSTFSFAIADTAFFTGASIAHLGKASDAITATVLAVIRTPADGADRLSGSLAKTAISLTIAGNAVFIAITGDAQFFIFRRSVGFLPGTAGCCAGFGAGCAGTGTTGVM